MSIPLLFVINGVAGKKDIKATFIEGLIYEGITSLNWLGERITIDVANKRLIVAQ